MSDLDKAREWSDRIRNASDNGHPIDADCYSAAEIIQSLPDQWVATEKVLKILDIFIRESDSPANPGYVSRVYRECAETLEHLLPPKLPTLADMTQEEREACQWMQAQTWHEVGIIVWVNELTEIAQLITRENGVLERKFKDVTPLPDLPKLEWPGGVVDVEIVDEPETTCSSPIHTPMQPSEVPPSEPWLIEVDYRKAIGTRYQGDTRAPWAVAALDGVLTDHSNDSEVTLIHKLVPEPPALPEGMRLADHKEYGRVVVSPKVDSFGDRKVFRSALGAVTGAVTGAVWEYCKSSELTFLDGAE